jgi:hypothetical protein
MLLADPFLLPGRLVLLGVVRTSWLLLRRFFKLLKLFKLFKLLNHKLLKHFLLFNRRFKHDQLKVKQLLLLLQLNQVKVRLLCSLKLLITSRIRSLLRSKSSRTAKKVASASVSRTPRERLPSPLLSMLSRTAPG